jgi:hypothetical protein
MQNTFAQEGIEAERLIILDPQPTPNREEIKEYLKLADIYLDSYPFSGTTSLIEPLEIGLPVISRKGELFRSAMGAAILEELKIFDLVAQGRESYIQLAISLGTNSELRLQKSREIKSKMKDNPSFLDSRSYAKKMAHLFEHICKIYQQNLFIEQLQLSAINLIIFPDWNQTDETIFENIVEALRYILSHPKRSQITLVVEISQINQETAEEFLSEIIMNLMLEESLDITQGPEISFLEQISEIQWQSLLALINGRIPLEHESQLSLKVKTEASKIL